MELRSGRVTSPTDDPPPPQGAAFASPALVNTPPPLPEQGGLSLDPDPASSSATSGVPPPPVVGGAQFFLPPVILRVLPLPGSPAPVGFIYDAAPDPVDGGLVAAASAFFSHQGHQVFHDPCPDLGRYCTSMGISPSSVLSVDRLPDYLLNSGLEILAGLTAPSPTAATLEGTAFLSAYLSPSSSGIGASSSGSGVRSLGGAPPDASSSSSGRAVGGLYDRSGPPPAPPPPYSVGQVPAPLVLDGLSGAPILGPGGSAPYPGPGGSSDPSGASPPRHSSPSVFLGAPASTLTTPVRNPYVASSRSAFVGGTVPTFTTPARNPYVASSRSIHTDPGGLRGVSRPLPGVATVQVRRPDPDGDVPSLPPSLGRTSFLSSVSFGGSRSVSSAVPPSAVGYHGGRSSSSSSAPLLSPSSAAGSPASIYDGSVATSGIDDLSVATSRTSLRVGSRSSTPIPIPTERFTLPPIKTADDYHQTRDVLMFWLRSPGFSTARSDDLLLTDARNALASQFWEGQIRTAIKVGPARFLFENTGTTFFGKGFEMIQVLEDHFRPSTISNSFTTLLSLFNDTQGDKESIHEFRSRFEGHMGALSRSSVAIPPILRVMLFLRGLHSRYNDLLAQFASKQKDLSLATIDSIVSDAKFMDEFKLVEGKQPKPGGSSPRVPSVSAVAIDKDGKEFRNPFEWLATYDSTFVKQRWQRSLRGNFYCAFCSSKEKHHPLKCPLLGDLNLKIITVGGGKGDGTSSGTGSSCGSSSGGPSPSSSSPPTAAPATVSPAPAVPDSGSPSAPAGLTAAVVPEAVGDEDSDDDFRWYGDDEGVDYKPNGSVSNYFPSCSRVSIEPAAPIVSPVGSSRQCTLPSASTASVDDIILPSELVSSLLRAVSPGDSLRLVVADTGATDHMLPDRSAFISYKSVRHLRVRMGNNSYAPVLGRGTAIVSLNGQRLLIRDVLHVPALRVPLYSLRAHLRQRGCGFVGSFETGMHVYFPGVVLSVDMSTDCHLSYEPLGKSAPLSSLHYVQPRCAPVVSPPDGSAFRARTDPLPSPGPALIEDDTSQDGGSYLVDAPASDLPQFTSLVPKQVRRRQSTTFSPDDLALISKQLQVLSDRLSGVTAPPPPPSPQPTDSASVAPRLLSSLSQDEVVRLVHRPGSELPPVRPCDRSNGSDTKTHWTSEELHRALGCRRFRNYKHILQTSLDGQWMDGGEFPMSLGSFTSIPKAPRGAAIDRERSFYLDIVHVDIAFGDCVSTGGFRYSLVFVDRATRYNWVFGLKDLSASSILTAFRLFRADAGSYARCFRCDCDPKLFGTQIREHLIDNASNIVAAAAGRQSSNGLVESHWKIMVHMARAYLTEKQMPRTFWFYAVVHSARMMNAIPGKFGGKLASPFLLVHGLGHDERTWFPLFSVCYFHHERDGDITRSHCQSHTMDGIAIGRSPTSNALLVYNPRTKRYYEPDSYRLDPYRLPSSVYPSLKYDGGLFCSLLRDEGVAVEEPYPPGTRVERMDPTTNTLLAGTVMDIPLSTDTSGPLSYQVLFDNGTSASIPLSEMASSLPAPPLPVPDTSAPSHDGSSSLLPPFLSINSRITYEHDGAYHKGFLTRSSSGMYRFSFKTHVKKKSEDWGVDLPNLPYTWVDLCTEGILVPGHVAHSFLRGSSGSDLSPTSASQSTFDPVANIVSAINLHRDCPPSLLQALASSHPDRKVWLQSYYEEKNGIESLGTFKRITLGEYRALREKGAPRAIPTMCVLTIKKDENLMPLRAKSRIVVLGNRESREWSKSDRFAPVLRFDSLRFLVSLAVQHKRGLKQGDCKNAFCHGILPPEEITIVRPPSGDPDAPKDEYWLLQKTLYGLRRSPRHWYEKIDSILRTIGLTPNAHDPCFYTGFIRDPRDPTSSTSSVPLSLGLYVDDFVYFSEDPNVESLFERLLRERVTVDFMGLVEWFLGIHFSWRITSSRVDVHLNQTGFAANLVEQFHRDSWEPTPTATPYRSGVPIDSIAPSSDPDDSPAQLRRTDAYQSLIGSIGWLATATRPDLAPIHSFLSSYNSKPSTGHMKAALYVLHYIHSTHDFGIHFTSSSQEPIHTFIHFPDSADIEAYTDAKPPSTSHQSPLTSYSDACWGSQLGSAVRDGTLLPLFKCRSMSGGVIFRQGGPIAWTAVRQERTSLSSCEAEIRATNEVSKLLMGIRNLAEVVRTSGHDIVDTIAASPLYNDNESCVKWSHNMTSKQIRHMEMRENSVREWVQDSSLKVLHVPGRINPADIFTKEMRDGTHFRRLRDSFMCSLSGFLQQSLLDVHLSRQQDMSHSQPFQLVPSAASSSAYTARGSYLSALLLSPLSGTITAISHLSSAGRQIFRSLRRIVPSLII